MNFSSISRTGHVLNHWSSWSAQISLSNESLFAQNGFRTTKLWPFNLSATICPENFRMRSVHYFCHISLYGCPNSLILDALEWEFHGSSKYQLFFACTSLSMCKIWWKQRGLLSSVGDVDKFDHKFMGTLCHACKTSQVHILLPRWRSGVETNANKPTIPRIFTCGIASLAKEK
jgi:hypothetical protein